MLKLQSVDTIHLRHKKIHLTMARIDKVYSLASGNKFYKLQPSFNYAKKKGIKKLVSFGGAYSNHIHALALFGEHEGFKTVGIIRGDNENTDLYANNPTLLDANKAGMKLLFVTRQEYRRRHDPDYINELQHQFPDALIIPEGGSNQLAIAGCTRLANEINQASANYFPDSGFDILTVACGTGATMAGLVCGLKTNQSAIGYMVLRDNSLPQRVQRFLEKERCHYHNYRLEAADYGGYAKLDETLVNFIIDWLERTGILLDPIYTGKMCMRVMQQIEAGYFSSGTSIMMVHSGGLQGWRGMKKRVIKLVGEQKWKIIFECLIRDSLRRD